MKSKLLLPLLPLTAALALGAAPAAGAEISPTAAANMANNCFACHGPDGRSPGTMPSLHQLTAQNMTALLKQFKTGERPSTVMGRHAKGYSDAEIEALAEYIAGLQK
ncbi:MAG TPA: c-type cytochrome [Acidiferrobacterales bacterium]|jgi:sulfide dehydrogenase cytochrome subunit